MIGLSSICLDFGVLLGWWVFIWFVVYLR